ncbi:hypothetical protein [Bacillus pakistanensis]|uniref:hypothetical protein n=1 Tax=Rossellomorea pakistanensis TaxID=992288 RepID=UPI0019625179|nr:hypothetical protein [Bacillus pakistanensis]
MTKSEKIKVELPPELYSKAEKYLEKIKEADSVIELNYYYKKFKEIIEGSESC